MSWLQHIPGTVPGSQMWSHGGRAQLDLAARRFGSALQHLEELAQLLGPNAMFMYQPDLVEVAVRTGQDDRAREEALRFAAWADRSGHRWAQAVAQRCLALVADEEPGFAAAVRLHEGAGRRFDEARTRLLYGEWLRRLRRRADARAQLSAAYSIFNDLGADGYAKRAGAELMATGATVEHYDHAPSPLSTLTAQEAQVVRLAAKGLSNRDIAAQLFLSPRTVGHHLYKAYPKLGVASRAELHEKISNSD